ncbi:hypothetical protein K439DRAFT_1564694 [Ramaria rubella]|nr:hypothetical protein K439DRAFT_1564694 [Ramaria rubella]
MLSSGHTMRRLMGSIFALGAGTCTTTPLQICTLLNSRTLFPGQDYHNSRLLDFQQVDNYVSNQLSNIEAPQRLWHDVHLMLVGPVMLDIVQHFVEWWNKIKK